MAFSRENDYVLGMSKAIESVLLVSKEGNDEARKLGEEIAAYLSEHGCDAHCCEHRTDAAGDVATADSRPFGLIIVLGGDGTLISAARRLYALGAPLVGLNLGQVGFLAELSRENWKRRLGRILEGRYRLSRRMLLSYSVRRKGHQVAQGVAVNDIVISRGSLARLIRLGMYFDGEPITSMRSDGVIISTPTGSTAYSVSAGGPLLFPETEAYSVTPICPFLNGFKPLVLPADRPLSVEIEEYGKVADVFLTEDGQEVVTLDYGDLVTIERCPEHLLLAQTGGGNFFSRLIGRGFLLGG